MISDRIWPIRIKCFHLEYNAKQKCLSKGCRKHITGKIVIKYSSNEGKLSHFKERSAEDFVRGIFNDSYAFFPDCLYKSI